MRGGSKLFLTGVLLVAWTFGAAPATAAAWAVRPAESRVLFSYERNGQAAEGRFAGFTGEGIFDPAAPGDATLEVRIESASIDLGDATTSAFATSAEWFDSTNYPVLVYRLLRLRQVDGDRYQALGALTIRGKTQNIETELTLTVESGAAHATGRLAVDRVSYWLGVGPSALFVDIGPEVWVSFDLTAHPAP